MGENYTFAATSTLILLKRKVQSFPEEWKPSDSPVIGKIIGLRCKKLTNVKKKGQEGLEVCPLSETKTKYWRGNKTVYMKIIVHDTFFF